MKSKELGLIVAFASIYAGLGYAFHPISFLAIQVRIACALIPLIAIFQWPATIGITIGGLIFNASSPLGPIDLLSMILFLPAKLAIQKWGLKLIPLHILSVSLWVAYMLKMAFGLPYLPTVLSVGIGEAIAELGLGLPLLKAVESRWNLMNKS